MHRYNRTAATLALLASTLLVPASRADDRYLIEFNAGGPYFPANCVQFVWTDEVRFYNTGTSEAVIHLLGLSNGGMVAGGATSLTLAAGETSTLGAGVLWQPKRTQPDAPVPLWVTHLDVPSGVIIASHGQLGMTSPACGAPIGAPPTLAASALGRYPLPVFADLVPPTIPQFHLGTGFGNEDSHMNVAIYNSASVIANARIDVRQACDHSLIDTRNVQVQPDTIVQVGGFSRGTCPASTYDVEVVVDQPSLSYVSTVANAFPTNMAVTTSSPN